MIMADVFHSAAWLTADLAALFGGYLFIPLNVSDSAASVSLVMAKHQVMNDFFVCKLAILSPQQVCCCLFTPACLKTVEEAISV
jgi:hypothetical protein